MAAPNKINLLHKRTSDNTYVSRLGKWALTIGRWVVIITEVVVILAVLYRFNLEQDIAKLKKEVEQERNAIVISQSFEEKFRETKDRLNTVNGAIQEFHQYPAVYSELVRSLPEDIIISTIAIAKNPTPGDGFVGSLDMQGISRNEESLSSLIFSLRRSYLFKEVQSTQIRLEESSGELSEQLKFTITAKIVSEQT